MPRSQPTDAMLEEVADYRASGMTWEAVAGKTNRSAFTIKTWPRKYPARWAAAYRKAELRFSCDSCAHSIVALRNLLASKDEKSRREAARTLVKHRIDLEKTDLRAGPPQIVISQVESDDQFARSLLEGLTDEQQEAYLAAIRPIRLLPPTANDSGDGAGPG
jgi:hypothetical protein